MVMRLRTSELSAVLAALREKGFRIIEAIDRSLPTDDPTN
jgi:hypothetical protein